MGTYEICLEKLELVNSYVDTFERRAALTKEYSQKIEEASIAQRRFGANISTSEILNEFMRVSDMMLEHTKKIYQHQYDIAYNDFKQSINQLTSEISKNRGLISKYETTLAKLEKDFSTWSYVNNFCNKHLTENYRSMIRGEANNPFEFELNVQSLSCLKREIQKIPDSFITIYVGNKQVSKSYIVDQYKPTYSNSESEINSKYIKVNVNIPDNIKGKLFKMANADFLELFPGTVNWYNNTFLKWSAANWYTLLLKSDFAVLPKQIKEHKERIEALRRLVSSDEDTKRITQKLYDEFLALKDFRRYIEAGHIKPMSKGELDRVKEQVLKAASSKLSIQPDDLMDYLALSNSKENFTEFKLACVRDRANKYIDKNSKLQSKVTLLEQERDRKLKSLNIPDLVPAFMKWRDEMPLLAQLGFADNMSDSMLDTLFNKIVEEASHQYSLKMYPTGGCSYHTDSAGKKFITPNKELVCVPSYITPGCNKKSRLVIHYGKDSVDLAQRALNRAVFNILLALPPRKAKLRIIDLAATNMASLFTTRLHPSIWNNEVVMNDRELRGVVEEWQARSKRVMQKCENIFDYNEKHQTCLEPYEVAIVLGYPGSLTPGSEELLRPFVQNGYKVGIIFIFLNNIDLQAANGQNLLNDKELFKFILPYVKIGKEYPLSLTPIADNQQLLETAIEYLNAEAVKVDEKPIAKQNVNNLVENLYRPNNVSEIKVAVGEVNGRSVYFEFDTVSHSHAFILGQSGTGKSRFLHNVIGNILLNHSPQNVELYLMDLKLGGVEFNPYRGVKHVRALLVDNNDRQITLEVLKELAARIEQRNKQIAELGVRNLEAYNKKADTPMSQILLVIDECQMLFTERPDIIERELRDILKLIVQQGRSQGVHLILATQTLMNSAIPIDGLQGAGLTDFYLFNCDSRDSEKLVKNSSPITGTLQTGEIYYHHNQNVSPDVQFQSFYVDDTQQEEILRGIAQKSNDLMAVPQYYFSGKSQAVLSTDVIASMQRRSRRSLCASLGVGIDLSQQPINVSLSEEQGENVLLFGLNKNHQVTRTATQIFLSALYSARAAGRDTDFVVLDCFSADEEVPYRQLFEKLEDEGELRQLFGRERGEWLVELGDSVRNDQANETVVLILGQDKWRELRNNRELPVKESADVAASTLGTSPSFLGGSFGGARSSQRTYRTELQYLLENGSERGVHFILQVDKPQNLIGGQTLSQQMIKTQFRHWVMLRSASDASLALRLSDEVRLENLSDDLDRLRAIYYSDDTDTYKLLTPYRYTTEEENVELLK